MFWSWSVSVNLSLIILLIVIRLQLNLLRMTECIHMNQSTVLQVILQCLWGFKNGHVIVSRRQGGICGWGTCFFHAIIFAVLIHFYQSYFFMKCAVKSSAKVGNIVWIKYFTCSSFLIPLKYSKMHIIISSVGSMVVMEILALGTTEVVLW